MSKRTKVTCGAKTRAGGQCQAPARENGRCKLHGGRGEVRRTEPVSVPVAAESANRPFDVWRKHGEPTDKAYSRAVLSTTSSAAKTSLMAGSRHIPKDVRSLQSQREVIDEITQEVVAGDLSHIEGMLAAQAITLEQLFHHYAQSAIAAKQVEVLDRHMKVALRAQSQCRAAIEALAEIKRPRVAVFATQANVTSGPQQVNSALVSAPELPRAWNQNPGVTNELLTAGGVNGSTVDR